MTTHRCSPSAALMVALVISTPHLALGQTANDGFAPGASGPVYACAVQPDGRIILGGRFAIAGETVSFNLARLKVDGSMDTAFNPGTDGEIRNLAVQPDGRIVVGGSFSLLRGHVDADGHQHGQRRRSGQLPGFGDDEFPSAFLPAAVAVAGARQGAAALTGASRSSAAPRWGMSWPPICRVAKHAARSPIQRDAEAALPLLLDRGEGRGEESKEGEERRRSCPEDLAPCTSSLGPPCRSTASAPPEERLGPSHPSPRPSPR